MHSSRFSADIHAGQLRTTSCLRARSVLEGEHVLLNPRDAHEHPLLLLLDLAKLHVCEVEAPVRVDDLLLDDRADAIFEEVLEIPLGQRTVEGVFCEHAPADVFGGSFPFGDRQEVRCGVVDGGVQEGGL